MNFIKKTAMLMAILLVFSCPSNAFEIVSLEKPVMEYEDCKILKTFSLDEMLISEGEPSEYAEEICLKAKEAGFVDKIIPDYGVEITKAQFAELGVKLYEKISGEVLTCSEENPFTDTENQAVLKLFSKGIVQGETFNTFNPDEKITTVAAEKIIKEIVRETKNVYYPAGRSKETLSYENAVVKVYTAYEYCENYKKNVAEKIEEMREKYPEGEFRNSENEPCDHAKNGYKFCTFYEGSFGAGIQCHGFAILLSDEIFGKNAPVTKFSDLSKIRVGDFIRYNDRHSMIVTGIYEDYITVAEANFNHDCKITWDRKVEKKFLEECSLLCVSRY